MVMSTDQSLKLLINLHQNSSLNQILIISPQWNAFQSTHRETQHFIPHKIISILTISISLTKNFTNKLTINSIKSSIRSIRKSLIDFLK